MITTLRHVATARQESGISLLSFLPDKRLAFSAGQFGLFVVGASARPFTICSSPEAELVEIATNLRSGTAIKRNLRNLRPGDALRLLGPIGNVSPPEDGRPVVFVTQGVGITPARSILSVPSARKRVLLHVGREHFRQELETLADDARFIPRASDLDMPLAAAVDDYDGAHYVLAGSRKFVSEAGRRLRGLGVPKRLVRSDPFFGLSFTY